MGSGHRHHRREARRPRSQVAQPPGTGAESGTKFGEAQATGRPPRASKTNRPRAQPDGRATAPHHDGGGPEGGASHGGPPPEPFAEQGEWCHTMLADRKSRSPRCLDPRTRHEGPWSLGVTGRPTPSPCNRHGAELRATKSPGASLKKSKAKAKPPSFSSSYSSSTCTDTPPPRTYTPRSPCSDGARC